MLRNILTKAGREDDDRLEEAGPDQMGLSLIEYSYNLSDRRKKAMRPDKIKGTCPQSVSQSVQI